MRIFPTTIKRTTVIVGGGGPNPSDAFLLALTFPETNAALTDAALFALLFPETNAALSDAASINLAQTDTNAALTDLLLRLGIGVTDTNAVPTDALALAIQFADTNPALSDLIFRLALSGFADTNAALTDNLLRLAIQFAESNAAVTDVSTYLLRAAYAETVAAMTDSLPRLGLGLGEINPAPTDARLATATWTNGATTVPAATNWTNPANAQGSPNATNATLTDTALNQLSGTLLMDPYPDAPADLQTWTITKVEWRFWGTMTFSALTTSRAHLEYSIDGTAWITLESLGTGVSHPSTGSPRVYDRTADRAWTWTNINNCRFRVRYVAAVLVEEATLNIDAVELRVTATKNPL
jgi:hypothetical protein